MFARFADDPQSVLFDCATPGNPRARYSYICVDPHVGIVADVKSCEDPFLKLEQALGDWRQDALPGLPPFQGGAAGLLGYELGGSLEALPAPSTCDDPFPDMAMAIYDTLFAFDHLAKKAWIVSSGFPAGTRDERDRKAAQRIEEFVGFLAGPAVVLGNVPTAPLCWESNVSRDQHMASVQAAIDHIYAGEISQANISQEFSAARPRDLSAFDIYRTIRERSPAPFAAYIGCGEGRVVCSASPERFLSVDAGGHVETRPIKGTRPRGPDAQEDKRLAEELLASEKDRAENLMIVDLMRNDLSRVCTVGSVVTPQLIALETFENVHHLVSVVAGQLAEGMGPVDLLRATFPGGSITGAPKIRAMEIIHELEQRRRGPYCGSAAWIGFDGAMDSSILIRTVTVTEQHMRVAAGGGIVSDSDPAEEYEETLVKVEAILSAFDDEGKAEEALCRATSI